MKIQCLECSKEISSWAKFCPHCGFALSSQLKAKGAHEFVKEMASGETKRRPGDWIGWAVVGLVVIVLMVLAARNFAVVL